MAFSASQLLSCLSSVKGKLLALIKPQNITSCHSEVEIAHEAQGLIGKCVVDIEAPTRTQLDKSKLSALLKATTNWPAMKIEKRAVTPPDLIQIDT